MWLFILILLSSSVLNVCCWRVGGVGRILASKHSNLSRQQISLNGRKPKVQNENTDVIVSPFDPKQEKNQKKKDSKDSKEETVEEIEMIPLNWANVETVLDDVRPFLQADGGDVQLTEINGAVIVLQLVGACGTCPSSQMTMKMGIERRLRQRITGIEDVVQKQPEAPRMTKEALEGVLDDVRPFLSIAGGSIFVDRIDENWAGLSTTVLLRMEGAASALQSVKLEIMERIQTHFVTPVRVEWVPPTPKW